ncbi:E3 ubiquitin-protein ligase TRIM71-like [Patiria miniata]|uniref:Uncharacterized protein n=1 Tax=Patiria miniata TaxID=46514 RepID=A0A914A8M4_PATMI|nr:E3 ubiquitin-protein ligase TRIM71-like [Patiria miniata]
MATGGTAEVLGKIGERHLECSICSTRFNAPKFLDCLHTFCFNCLQNLRQGEDPQGVKLKCPLCRRETILGKNGVEDLPTNLTLSALVEEFTVQEQLLKGQGSEIKCQSCDEQKHASSFCVECCHFLCQDCYRAHERLAITKSHKTYTMAQLQSGEVAYKSKLRKEPKCDKHVDQNLNVYCKTCETLICTTCSVLKHEKHSRTEISKTFEECKQKIAKLMTEGEEKKATLSNAHVCIVKSRQKLDSMFEATIEKISQKADKEVARIRKMEQGTRETEQKLKKEAEEIYEDRVQRFETTINSNKEQIKEVEQTLDEVYKIMKEEIQTQILDLQAKLFQNLKELIKKQSKTVPEKLHFIDFQERDEKTLGRLFLKDEWRLEKQMAYETNSVAGFSNEVVTVERYQGKLVSHVPTSNPQSPFLFRKLEIPDLRRPQQVAVNRLDQLIIINGRVVKTFNREYQLLHQFQLESGFNHRPTCLAVDDNNQIAVGYQVMQEISLHRSYGTLLKKLPAPGISDQLAISNQHLIYIKLYEGKMVALDYNGNKAFEVDVKGPKSVCCDSQGNIYILVSTPHIDQQNIKIFSPDGQKMGYLPVSNTDDLPRYALCMAFTPSGDLVIGTYDMLRIFQRV